MDHGARGPRIKCYTKVKILLSFRNKGPGCRSGSPGSTLRFWSDRQDGAGPCDRLPFPVPCGPYTMIQRVD